MWYGEKYLQFMGIPVSLKFTIEEKQNISQVDENSKLTI